MAALQRTDNSRSNTQMPGMFVMLLGGVVMAGWIFGLSALTRILPEWNPMVPSTAICFVLSGLLLIKCRRFTDQVAPVAQRGIIGLILLIVLARLFEMLSGHEFGVEHLAGVLLGHPLVGHMSPVTMTGFLLFSITMLANLREDSDKLQVLPRVMAIAFMVFGLLVLCGYLLKLQYFFEAVYLATGLTWVSLPTAVGMTLLGVGLWNISHRVSQGAPLTEKSLSASRIHRATVMVVTATSITTALASLQFLNTIVLEQASSSMTQMLNANQEYTETDLNVRTQRALVASLNPKIQQAATDMLVHPGQSAIKARAFGIVGPLLAHGFSGIGLEQAQQRVLIGGHLLAVIGAAARLGGDPEAYLIWDNGYFLRVRLPLTDSPKGGATAYLVLEQTLPRLGAILHKANQWGTTGAMLLCSRLDRTRLLCFPQREQNPMYIVPDTFNGAPIPMAYALAGQTGIENLTDYRGRNVLAAYGPIGHTGLGLVVRKDQAELYVPAKREVLFSIPLVAILIMAGLWVIRLRVAPLIRDLSDARDHASAAQASFDAAMQGSPDGFVIYASVKDTTGDIVDFRCTYLNQNAESMAAMALFGKLPDILVGNTFLQAFPERKEAFALYKRVAQTGEVHTDEFPLAGADGSIAWFQRQAVPMPQGLALTYRDITRQKQLVQQLEYSNRLRTAIVESAAYSIISTDVNGTILTFNQAAERMLWYRAEEMVGKATPGVFHDADEIRERADALSHELGHTVQPGFEVFVAKARMNLQEEREWTYIRKDGSRFPVLLSVTALHDESSQINGFLGIANDISERKRTEDYIRHIALHDVLTGLPNRALLDDRVMVAVEQQRRSNSAFALVMMDIDRFKNINDSMGHHIGDLLLKEFVERVKSCLRPTDTLARMGGDEFVLLLPESDEAGAAIVVGRILRALVPQIDVGLQEVYITSSMGISICPSDGQDIHELLRCADVAMYWVKEHGRNGYKLYAREMDSGETERLGLERDMHIALEQGGFSLVYQPKVDLKTGVVIGIEALLRLRKTNGQHVSPADFIPLAEDIGLIVPIGQWVLATACRDTARMQEVLGVALKVAVNISPRQFMNGNLVSAVEDALHQSGLAASQLELEITEGVLMDERVGVSTALFELNQLGVTIAIDDFGTGYSSLSYLKRYPISMLKIDQSFVRDMTIDVGDAALVVAIIAMGRSLNIPIVAEGIETEKQLAFLAANECEMGQGFFIARPLPFDELMQWFASSKRWKLGKNASSAP